MIPFHSCFPSKNFFGRSWIGKLVDGVEGHESAMYVFTILHDKIV